MDQLLKKFANIEINHSRCLDKEDEEFCEKQQQTYECVLRHFRAMFRGMKMLHDKETEFRSKLDEKDVSSHNIYHKNLIIADTNIQMDLITSMHQELVERIFTYFRSRYGLDLSAGAYEKYISIQEPEKPAFSFESSASYFAEEGRRGRKEEKTI